MFGEEDHQIDTAKGLSLYYHNYSYYSHKVLMALYEKNLSFEHHTINLQKEEQYDPWFLKLNPLGEVPVLQDNGKVIPDSACIIDYLEEKFKNENIPMLIPTDQGAEIKEKVIHFRYLIDQIPAGSLTLGSLFHSEFVRWPKPPFVGPVRRFLANSAIDTPGKLKKHAELNPTVRDILLEKASACEMRSSVFINPDEYLQILNQVDEVLFNVEKELATHTGDKEDWWLCCNRFTVADIALTVLLERIYQLGYEFTFWKGGKRPQVEKYYARVKQRESYKKTIPTTLFHVKMFLNTYRKPVIIGLGISISLVAFVLIFVALHLSGKLDLI